MRAMFHIFLKDLKKRNKSMSDLKDFCFWLEKEDYQNWEIERYVENLVKDKKRLEDKIKARLSYCKKKNGLPYCKNCGLSEEDYA